MSFIVKDTGSGGGNFQPAPEGQFQAVCVDVVDYGINKRVYNGKEKDRDEMGIVFQLKVVDGNSNEKRTENGGRFTVSQRFTKSLHENGKLRPFLESWRGRKFSADELSGFDVEKLLGANCVVQIVHNEYNNNIYANISSIMPLNTAWNLSKLEPENYTRKKDREAAQAAAAVTAPPAQASAPVSFVPPNVATQAKVFDADEVPF